MAGRPVVSSRTSALLRLPRPMAAARLTGLRNERLQPFELRSVPRKVTQLFPVFARRGPVRGQARSKFFRNLDRLYRPTMLALAGFCIRRQKRREVLFAKQVAGRRHGSGGGPDMRGAKHTLESFYTCAR